MSEFNKIVEAYSAGYKGLETNTKSVATSDLFDSANELVDNIVLSSRKNERNRIETYADILCIILREIKERY